MEPLPSLNTHPLNQHAEKLLTGWLLRPEPDQLHLVTLVGGALFATEEQAAKLKRLLERQPADVLAFFADRPGFEDAFLKEDRALEGAKLILDALT